jgi:hypothetical protein
LKACRKACAKKNAKFQSINLHESSGKASEEDSIAEGKELA